MNEKGERATSTKGVDLCEKSLEVLAHLGFAGGTAMMARLDPDHQQYHSFKGRRCTVWCNGDAQKEKWHINTPMEEREPVSSNVLEKLQALCGTSLREMTPAAEVTVEEKTAPSAPKDDPFSQPAPTESAYEERHRPTGRSEPIAPLSLEASSDIPF